MVKRQLSVTTVSWFLALSAHSLLLRRIRWRLVWRSFAGCFEYVVQFEHVRALLKGKRCKRGATVLGWKVAVGFVVFVDCFAFIDPPCRLAMWPCHHVSKCEASVLFAT